MAPIPLSVLTKVGGGFISLVIRYSDSSNFISCDFSVVLVLGNPLYILLHMNEFLQIKLNFHAIFTPPTINFFSSIRPSARQVIFCTNSH
ncbi:hypothetical protein Patl1_25873 [Pistacia atlantica]|uniref:Uncharacterized protein n=1 Tax=Pistacia atlantica TaxID=434234 RepID=A0ACC1AZQ0_9ROSI|nr:hypothetical protein Patl1_25873 [Pistacia atlantica]